MTSLSKESFTYSKHITHQFIGSRIITQFTPEDAQGQSINLNQLASSLGYDHFNWVNYVELDPYGIVDHQGQKLETPYNDPPQGGYRYAAADKLPFYWDLVKCDRCKPRHHIKHGRNSSQFKLVFDDSPSDYRLQPGEAVEFVTSLVGVKHYDPQQYQAEWDILHTFRWQLTNPRSNYSQVSLIESDVDSNSLSLLLLSRMQLDGALVINSQQSTVNNQQSTINNQQSTINSQQSTINRNNAQ
ncbi:MAG: hypothetical protein AAF383_21360 [Cyanobacteria bacterium P01_A01_bin.83]